AAGRGAERRVRSAAATGRRRRVEFRADVVEPALLSLVLGAARCRARARGGRRRLERSRIARRSGTGWPPGRQRVVTHSLRARVVRGSPVDRRDLERDDPVVRAPRACPAPRRLPAARRGYRWPVPRAAPGQGGGLLGSVRLFRGVPTLLVSACSASTPLLRAFPLTD